MYTVKEYGGNEDRVQQTFPHAQTRLLKRKSRPKRKHRPFNSHPAFPIGNDNDRYIL